MHKWNTEGVLAQRSEEGRNFGSMGICVLELLGNCEKGKLQFPWLRLRT